MQCSVLQGVIVIYPKKNYFELLPTPTEVKHFTRVCKLISSQNVIDTLTETIGSQGKQETTDELHTL